MYSLYKSVQIYGKLFICTNPYLYFLLCSGGLQKGGPPERPLYPTKSGVAKPQR